MGFGTRRGHSRPDREDHHTRPFPAPDLATAAPGQPDHLPGGRERSSRRGVPGPVMLAALLLYLFAAVCVLLALGVFGAVQGDPSLAGNLPAGVEGGGIGTLIALVALAVGVALVAGRLRRGRRWAWLLVVGLSIVTLVFALISLAGPEPVGGTVAVPVLVSVLLLVLLNVRQARGWFR